MRTRQQLASQLHSDIVYTVIVHQYVHGNIAILQQLHSDIVVNTQCCYMCTCIHCSSQLYSQLVTMYTVTQCPHAATLYSSYIVSLCTRSQYSQLYIMTLYNAHCGTQNHYACIHYYGDTMCTVRRYIVSLYCTVASQLYMHVCNDTMHTVKHGDIVYLYTIAIYLVATQLLNSDTVCTVAIHGIIVATCVTSCVLHCI